MIRLAAADALTVAGLALVAAGVLVVRVASRLSVPAMSPREARREDIARTDTGPR